MIHVVPESRLIFVRGVRSIGAIEEAVLEATGKKRWINRGLWNIVGLADENSHTIVSGMPFSPPDVEREPIGFKRNT